MVEVSWVASLAEHERSILCRETDTIGVGWARVV